MVEAKELGVAIEDKMRDKVLQIGKDYIDLPNIRDYTMADKLEDLNLMCFKRE